jgi:hypothetical protein
MLARTPTATACVSPGRSWGPVPEGLGYEEEDEDEAESNHDSSDPEDPSPPQRLHNSGAHERDEVLAAKQEERVYSKPIRSLVEEEDLGDGGAGKTFDGRDSNTLDNTRHDQGSIIWRQCTPDGRHGEQDDGAQVDWPFAPENGSRRGYDTAQAQAQHVQAGGESHLGYGDVVCVCYVVEARSEHGRHATADHAVEAEGHKSKVTAELPPVQRVVGRVFGLGLEDKAAVFGAFLLGGLSGAAGSASCPWPVDRGQRRGRSACPRMLETQRLVAVVRAREEDNGACGAC